jgi:alpha-1,6-mannosyltransferase
VKRITGLDWPLLTLAACLLALSAAGALTVSGFDDPKVGAVMLLQSVPYAVATWLLVRGGEKRAASGRALASILLVGVAMRCLLLPGTPVSNDLFRYIWDGRVQAAGINPYLYVPTDAALSALRDAATYPFINRADYAPTIYPPSSQIVFYLVTRISEAPIAMKAAMVAFEGLAVWAMLQLLALRGLPRSRILLYAWHPLPLWEFARSGHLDIVAIAFLLLAFLASERGSPVLAGVALGAGVLAKYFPVVTGPALYKRWDWRLPIAFAATIVALYLPYIAIGPKVLGFLGGYISEEGLDRGSAIFFWELIGAIVPLPQQAFALYLLAAAAVLAVLALFVLMRAPSAQADLAGAMRLAVASTLLISPHYVWYFAWLVPFLPFYPVVGVIYLTCACASLYFAHWPPTLLENAPIYLPCIVILIAEFALRHRRKTEESHADAVAA